MIVRRAAVVPLLVLGVVAATAGHAQRPPAPAHRTVDSLLERVRTDWRVPGIAVGVVRAGRVVLATGSGARDRERRLPVTPRTLFGIGSNTKSFTGLLVAMLVHEGRLAWSDPVRRHLPELELADPVASRLATPADLLTHMTGLPRHDGMWYGRSRSRADIVARLRFLEPSATFRARWQYNNLMFLAAGVLAERLTQTSWDQLVAERIFGPLGMTDSRTAYRDQLQAPERAQTYELRGDSLELVPLRDLDNVAPAGSIASTVHDMLRYVAMFLADGRIEGRQVVPEAAVRAVRTPHVVMGVDVAAPDPSWPELGPRLYGLGLAQTHYRGQLMMLHGGGIDGYTSQMTWMPAHDLGIVVLTNSTSPASEIVSYTLYDLFLGLEPIDWNARLRAAMTPGAPAARNETAGDSASPGPAHPLPAYAGRYEHPGYGAIIIGASAGGLDLELDRLRTTLVHRRFETFQSGPEARRFGIIPTLASFTVTFRTDADGRIDRLEIPFEPSVPPIAFVRVR